jgi:hypothetical protein
MSVDPRRVLDDAARQRTACELLPRGGGLVKGTLLRVEQGGVVISAAEHHFTGGEDVRVWFSCDGKAWTFEASVVRAGVPVPDRGRGGLLLGFIDAFSVAAGANEGSGRVVALLPPGGGPISLVDPPARLLHLAVGGAAFTLPADYRLVFVESGRVRVRLAAPGHQPITAEARVRALSPGEDYLVYDLGFEQVEDPEGWRVVVEALQRTLE